MHRKLWLVVSLMVLLALALGACAPAATPAAAPTAAASAQAQPTAAAPAQPITTTTAGTTSSAGKTLVIDIGADATYLDPESVMNNESGFVMSTLFDGLTKFKPGTSEPGPGLATSWDVSADGKQYTFHLRQNVKFSDGTPWNADAAMAELDRVTNKNNQYYIYKQPGISSFADFTWTLMTAAKKIDDYTIEIDLKEPNSPFLADLAMVWSGFMSPAAVKQYGFNVSDQPSGTGPYRLVEWVRNDHITVEANPDYWGGAPKINRIIFKVVPESSVRLLQLEKGDAQILADVSPDDYATIKADKDLALVTQPGLTVSGIALPTTTPPFNDVRVRQALNYAVNKDEMNQYLYKNAAVAAATGMPPILMGYPKDLQPYAYDPDKAKQLLAQAGFPNGFKATMLVYQNPRGYNPVGDKEAVAIQEYWAKVGVQVDFKTLEWGAFLQAARSASNNMMCMVGWSGDNGDPDNFLYEMFDSSMIPAGNEAHYTNPQLDAILEQARAVVDPTQRAQLYSQAATIIHNDAPWVFVNHTLQVRATRANVTGFQLNPLQMFWYMEDVDLQ
jgi:peptide/nickel transport system substrate-binding protein